MNYDGVRNSILYAVCLANLNFFHLPLAIVKSILYNVCHDIRRGTDSALYWRTISHEKEAA